MSILEHFRYRNDVFQSDIFVFDIGMSDIADIENDVDAHLWNNDGNSRVIARVGQKFG